MERLWAPWRIEYIRSNKTEHGCIFCNKPQENNDLKNLILYRGTTAFIIMNYYPYNNGHLMVVPYRHTCEFHELTGVPVLLNTSFNLAGEPIVCSPKDAIRTFFTSGIDILVLGPFVLCKHP